MLIDQASREQRILLTEDKDSAGVILFRFPGNARRSLAQAVQQVVREQGEQLLGAFVVVQPGHTRISRKPGASA